MSSPLLMQKIRKFFALMMAGMKGFLHESRPLVRDEQVDKGDRKLARLREDEKKIAAQNPRMRGRTIRPSLAR